ncbi:hypothetical protein [Rufibacter quisquiliarum]|uniref:Oligoribonuclease (3'-5' exoribonuclease) n=1 Tax=Rufibacter quisquiliarum TaxID=1549639 RepID=A0A839GQ88_9BACT|nr:hypothetical protein [Rufibacter quisquiliarum]MBA9078959.1 oligoribonuclease (3'-5' exoribonuclease) [Rufibacter quisquiliarum]
MKIVSIDIETTGLDINLCQVIEIGAVIEDPVNIVPLEELPEFRAMLHYDTLHWEEVAQGLHKESGLLEEWEAAKAQGLLTQPEKVASMFRSFLIENGFVPGDEGQVVILAAGKNFTRFDRPRLEKLPEWKANIRFHNWAYDPCAYYIDVKTDQKPPDLKECKRRAGLIETKVIHKAVPDAKAIIELLRIKNIY